MPKATNATIELVRLRTGREPQDIVRELFIDKRLSDREIAEFLGVNRVTVNVWRKHWGIRREDRPEATDLVA